MGSIASAIHDSMKRIQKTGPAQPHHMGKILPTHNILKPGAHPKHMNHMPKLPNHHNDKMHNHHEKPEHHDEHKP